MDSLTHIPASEAKASLLSVADSGRVCWWRGRLFRGVAAGEAPSVQPLFDCGLLPALIDKGLVVRSWIAPALPAWYREERFRGKFAKRFDVIERAQLEDNRVLFVGATR